MSSGLVRRPERTPEDRKLENVTNFNKESEHLRLYAKSGIAQSVRQHRPSSTEEKSPRCVDFSFPNRSDFFVKGNYVFVQDKDCRMIISNLKWSKTRRNRTVGGNANVLPNYPGSLVSMYILDGIG